MYHRHTGEHVDVYFPYMDILQAELEIQLIKRVDKSD